MPRDVQLQLSLEEPLPDAGDGPALVRTAARALRTDPSRLSVVRVQRISLDARRRRRGWSVVLRAWDRGEEVPPPAATTPTPIAPVAGDAPHAVVVGSGPAGLFCALELLAAGVRATVLERGTDVRTRRRALRTVQRGEEVDPDSNYCFGEGGAGTYSDGKLYTRSGSKREIRAVFEQLVAHGAPPEILWTWRPHIGSNRLPEVVAALRETIRAAGGEVRFSARAEELETAPDTPESRRVRAVLVRDTQTNDVERLTADAVVLATGHSSLDSVAMAARAGARLEPKGFAMGVRIEHPQPWLDDRQYDGVRAKHALPAAFYELTEQCDGRGVYSFCMCPGGFIVPTTTASDRVVVNGMSLSRRDSPFANSGLVVGIEPEDWCGERGREWGWPDVLCRAAALGAADVPADGRLPERPDEDPLFGVRLQLALETLAAEAGGGRGRAPAQRADHVLAGRGETCEPGTTSYHPGLTAVDFAELLPPGMLGRLRAGLAAFEGRLPGFATSLGQLIGVESRTSSPVRLVRDRVTLECEGVRGLFPAGEGAGYAGGIVSAALDGRRVARGVTSLVQP